MRKTKKDLEEENQFLQRELEAEQAINSRLRTLNTAHRETHEYFRQVLEHSEVQTEATKAIVEALAQVTARLLRKET